ncbi:MAG: hypothetical protein ACR2RB_03325 [Gammaproteobacteria bacterium]
MSWEHIKPLSLPFPPDLHARLSFEIAVNRVYCGMTSHLITLASTEVAAGDLQHIPAGSFRDLVLSKSLREFISENTAIIDTPIRLLVEQNAGSREIYCAGQATSFLNNENSLMYLHSGLLSAIGGITPYQIGLTFRFIRFAALILFAVLLIRVGFSPIVSLLALVVATYTAHVVSTTHYYSIYPFLVPAVLFFISLCGLALSAETHRRWLPTIVLVLLLGFAAAGIVNVRTSYTVVILFLFGLFLMFVVVELLRTRKESRGRTYLLGIAAAVMFAVGYSAFTTTLIKPLTKLNTQMNYAHHPIAHPLVLGLAWPENELSRAEGIEWNDGLGLELARRIDNDVTYLGPTYEQALFTYYAKLWFFYPERMRAVYEAKLRMAGRNGVDYLLGKLRQKNDMASKLQRLLLWPITLFPDGFALFLAYLAICAATLLLWCFHRARSDIAYVLLALAGAATLLHLEAAIIIPVFNPSHQSYLMFWFYMVGILVFQLAGASTVYLSGFIGKFRANDHSPGDRQVVGGHDDRRKPELLRAKT